MQADSVGKLRILGKLDCPNYALIHYGSAELKYCQHVSGKGAKRWDSLRRQEMVAIGF